jgi:hypothetical protein
MMWRLSKWQKLLYLASRNDLAIKKIVSSKQKTVQIGRFSAILNRGRALEKAKLDFGWDFHRAPDGAEFETGVFGQGHDGC